MEARKKVNFQNPVGRVGAARIYIYCIFIVPLICFAYDKNKLVCIVSIK